MPKFTVHDRAQVTGGHVLAGQAVVIVKVGKGGAFVATDTMPDVGYWAAWRELKSPPSPVPKADGPAAQRAKSTCSGCGYRRSACQCLELHLMRDLKAYGVPVDETNREFKFAEDVGRNYRADFAWPDQRVLVEVEGGSHQSRHRDKAGYSSDLEKYNLASRLGYVVYRYDTGMVTSGRAAREIAEVLGIEVDP